MQNVRQEFHEFHTPFCVQECSSIGVQIKNIFGTLFFLELYELYLVKQISWTDVINSEKRLY